MSEKTIEPFVFLDAMSRPYKVQMWGGELWLFYWNSGPQNWVSLRRVEPIDIPYFEQTKLSPEHAALYDA